MKKSLSVKETQTLVKLLDRAMETSQQPYKFRVDIDMLKTELFQKIAKKRVCTSFTREELDWLYKALDSHIKILLVENSRAPRELKLLKVDSRIALLKRIRAILNGDENEND